MKVKQFTIICEVKQFTFKDCELFFSVVGNLAKGNKSKFSNTKPGQGKQKNLNFALPRHEKAQIFEYRGWSRAEKKKFRTQSLVMAITTQIFEHRAWPRQTKT